MLPSIVLEVDRQGRHLDRMLRVERLNKIDMPRHAIAIKKGQAREKAVGFQEMGIFRCDICGEEFLVAHDPASADKKLAEKQAKWLEKVLAEEHERDKKHPDRIELPA